MKTRIRFLIAIILISILPLSCTIPEVEDVDPPVVSLLYPYEGGVVSGEIIVSIQATDDREVEEVWYHIDGVFVAKASGASHIFNLDVATFADEKAHVFQAFASDKSGNRGASLPTFVTVSKTGDITAPNVEIINPVEGQVITGSVKVVAHAFDDRAVSEVVFFIDGDSVSSDLNYPYEYLWSLAGAEPLSSHTVFVRAFDNAGNFANSSQISITVSEEVVDPGDVVPPVASLIYPLAGQILYDSVNVQVDASDDQALERVDFYIDGIFKSSVTAQPEKSLYTYAWDTAPLLPGSMHTLYFQAVDVSGNKSTNLPVSFTIRAADNVPPTIALMYPLEGDTLTGTVNIAVDVYDDDEVAYVEYYVDGGTAGNPDFIALNSPWHFLWNTAGWANNRTHTLYIKAFDRSGNFSTLGPLQYIIN